MQVQVRTDNHIQNNEALIEQVRAEVEGALQPRFTDRLHRVEVYLQDTNSHKGGTDIRCAIEAHLAGLHPVAVDGRAGDVEQALGAAVDKLIRVLDHTLGRLQDRGGPVSMSGEST